MEIKKPPEALPPKVEFPRSKRVFPKVLREHMKKMGMEQKPGESKKEWIERHKKWAKELGYSGKD